MNSTRFPFSILIALVALLIAQLAYCYPQLPETVASHFDSSGVPNGWMSKTAFVVIIGLVTIISAGPTAGLAVLLPTIQGSINLPNKEYWISPARRDDTLAFVASSMIWIECTVVALLLVINHFVCRFNIEHEQALALPMIPTMAMFFGIIAFIIGRMIVKFKKTE